MEMGVWRGVIAVLTFASFLGICWWAYRPSNKQRFEADALLPFDDHDVEMTSFEEPDQETLR